MERLARALGQVSASEDAAESIQRGDYDQAAQQLSKLAQESDQLSNDARNQLSQALRRAAAETTGNQALADRERRAADALAARDYQQQRAALSALGEEVARAAGQTASQSELSDAMAQLQEERQATAGNAAAPAGQSPSADAAAQSAAAGQSAPQDQSGAGGQAAGALPGNGEGGLGDVDDGTSGLDPSASGSRQSLGDAPSEKAGSNQVGAPAPRLDVAGKPVEVQVRPRSDGEPGMATDRPGPEDQVVQENQTRYDSDGLAAPIQAGGQAERIVVPGEQRQVVRDYFARRDGKGSP
jgi:hypothetical protein